MHDKPTLPFAAMPVQDDYPMTPKRRDLYLRVVDDYPDYAKITHRLFFLDDHFPPNKLDAALAWLVLHQVTGVRFTYWFKEECKSSDLEMHRLLLSIVDNIAAPAVVAGRNFKT